MLATFNLLTKATLLMLANLMTLMANPVPSRTVIDQNLFAESADEFFARETPCGWRVVKVEDNGDQFGVTTVPLCRLSYKGDEYNAVRFVVEANGDTEAFVLVGTIAHPVWSSFGGDL